MRVVFQTIIQYFRMKSLRNLFHVLKRFSTASLLNLFGLSIAFAAFILIMMQVRHELTFDHCHENRDRVFRLEWSAYGQGTMGIVSRKLAFALPKASSHIEKMGIFNPIPSSRSVTILQGDTEKHFKDVFHEMSPSITEIFSFKWAEGDSLALTKPGQLIIPQSIAHKWFEDISPVGKRIQTEDTTWVVGAVYKDFPKNSTMQNDIYYAIDPQTEFTSSWFNANDCAYVLMDSPSSVDGFLEELVDHIPVENFGYADKEKMRAEIHSIFRLNSLSDLYYTNDVKYVFSETGSRQTTLLLIGIALVILLIAGINFTNFTTALTPMRIKSINTQKVLGSTVGKLRSSLVMEGVFVSFVSFLVGLLIVYICRGTFIGGLISSGINFATGMPVILLAAVMSLITGVLAGLYPAFYMTSFPPAMVIKGSFGLSMKGKQLRTVLLCVQYVASIVLLIVSFFMMLQNRHMLSTSYGYQKEQVLTVELSDVVLSSRDAFSEELTNNEAVEYVGYTFAYLSCMDDCPVFGREYKEEQLMFNAFVVTKDFMKVLGVPVIEGRDFTENDYLTSETLIFNQMAKEQLGVELGNHKEVNTVGFIPNIIYSSLRSPMSPMAFLMQPKGTPDVLPMNICYIRVKEGPHYQAAVDHIGATIKKFDPTFPYEIHPLVYFIEDTYSTEKNMSRLISIFGVLCILISIVGIYGLVVFETEYKRREIGVRKVFGSTTLEIMQRFSKRYVQLILICSVVAVPISYFFVNKWFTRFTTRIPIYWWVFVAAFLLIAVVTLATTTWQNYRAASANPIDSLKNE